MCRYAATSIGGKDISPPLAWSNLPPGTLELVLILEDPDAPICFAPIHLVASNIPPSPSSLPEGALCKGAQGQALILGKGTFGRFGYHGPRPPNGHGPHKYIFQIYALGKALSCPRTSSLKTIIPAMAGHVLARGTLTGIFERV